jgi:hypothetical protein
MEEINSDGSSRKAFHVKRDGGENVLMKLWDERKAFNEVSSFVFVCLF